MNTSIDRKELREKRRCLHESNREYGLYLVEVPRIMWPEHLRAMPVDKVYRSRKFLVQVYHETFGAVRLSICRSEIDNDGAWKDGLSWDELQDLKCQAGFRDCDAVEVYPAERDVVNVANMRHLWVLCKDNKLPFIWRKKN